MVRYAYNIDAFKVHFNSAYIGYVKKHGTPVIFKENMPAHLLIPLFSRVASDFVLDLEENQKKYKITDIKYTPGKNKQSGMNFLDFHEGGDYHLVVGEDKLCISAKRSNVARDDASRKLIMIKKMLFSDSGRSMSRTEESNLTALVEWFDAFVDKQDMDSLIKHASDFQMNLPEELKQKEALKRGIYKTYRVNHFPYAGI